MSLSHRHGAGVETDIVVFTADDEFAVLASIPASEAALPVPPALADVPGPSLSAVASPSANELVEAVLSVVSTDPSELASIWEEADAEPVPADAADTSTLAAEDAEAVPSLPVLAVEPAASTATVPLIEPPPTVETSTSPSADDSEAADVPSDVVEDAPSPKAWPWASPSPLDVPLKLADAVVPSAVAEFAAAEPVAEAPVPAVTRSTLPSTAPSLPKLAEVVPSAVEVSAAVSLPVAPACVVVEESAELPVVPAL